MTKLKFITGLNVKLYEKINLSYDVTFDDQKADITI